MLKTLGELLSEEDYLVDYTINGKCSGCGQCCSNYLPLSDREIKNIHRYIAKHPVKETARVPLSKGVFIMTCPFLDDIKSKDKCKIYDVRPAICRCFQCNQSAKDIEKNKNLLHYRRRIINMREEFMK